MIPGKNAIAKSIHVPAVLNGVTGGRLQWRFQFNDQGALCFG